MLTLTLAAKLTGSALLFSSVGALAYLNKKRDARRLLRLEGQLRFVRFVRQRIDRFLSPISEIIRDCGGDVIGDMLIGCVGADFFDIDGLRSILASGEFYADGGKIFDGFLSSLGSSYRENEIAACDACIKDLEELREKLQKELPRERKSRNVLSFCLVAAIVIILF